MSLAVLLSYPALVYLGQLCGIHVLALRGVPLFLVVLTLALLLDVWRRRDEFLALGNKDRLGALGICLFVISIFVWVMSPTDVIPASDAIAVPAFARIFFDQGIVPEFVGAERRVPFIYPPGFPILWTDLFKIFSPITVLVLFKYVCIVAVGITPFMWAWAVQRLFTGKEVSLWVLACAMALGFLSFDRTLVYALAIAGKNAQLFQSALVPLFFVYLVSVRRLGSCIVAALCCCGMFLLHYSGLYVMAVLLGAWSVVQVVRAGDLQGCLRPWGIFAGAVMLFIPKALHASKNSGAVAIGSSQYVPFNWDLFSVITQEFNPFIFIFNEIGIPWSYKGWWTLSLLGIAAMYLLIQRLGPGDESARARRLKGVEGAFWFCVCSWVGAGLLAYGMVPVPGINLDFTRWFSYNLLAAAIGMSVVVIVPYLRRSRVAAVCATLVVGFGLWNSFYDVQGARGWIKDHVFPMADIRKLSKVIPSSIPCQLVTRNGGLGTFMYQIPRAAEYVPVISSCEIISGAYIAPDSYGLDPSGAPTVEFLKKRRERGEIFYLGGHAGAKRLRERYQSDGITLQRVRLVDNLGLWRIDLPADVEQAQAKALRAEPPTLQ